MTATSTLIISLSIGIPIALLAIAIAYRTRADIKAANAWQAAELEQDSEGDAAVDTLLVDLQTTVEEMRQQLTRQRDALTGLLSEQATQAAAIEAPAAIAAPSLEAVGEAAPAQPVPTSIAPVVSKADIHSKVLELSAEGLSDRAIARRLRVGVEEVRMIIGQPAAAQTTRKRAS